MALKDWTKTGENEWHKFVNGKSGKFYDGIFFTKTINGDYNLSSFYRKTDKKYHYKQGRLKTKADAMRLAKQYMTEK